MGNTDMSQIWHNRLVEVLRLLCSDAQVQIDAFPNDVVTADEIALEFEDAKQGCESVASSECYSQDLTAIVSKIDEILKSRSTESSQPFWTHSALRDDPDWKRIRRLASEGLNLMGVTYEPPVLDWLTFVRGE